VALILSAVFITGGNYILNPPADTTPVVIFSEEVELHSLPSVVGYETFTFTVEYTMNQIRVIVNISEYTENITSIYNSTDEVYVLYGVLFGTYASEWIDVDPGNYTLEIAYTGFTGNITILGRYDPDWM
jgi:beta-glucanase (GH16 family)